MTGFNAEMKGTKEPLAEEVGVQMTARGRCASRSGAGIPPVTFQDVGASILYLHFKIKPLKTPFASGPRVPNRRSRKRRR